MTPKDLTKLFAVLCAVSATVMAAWGIYESFSQSATSKDWDWALRTYLTFASLTFAGFLFTANNRNEYFKLFTVKVKWWLMYLIAALSFYFVSATNVSDYSIAAEDYDQVKVLAHMIFTGFAVLSSAIIGWHFYPKKSKERYMAMGPIVVGVGLFLCSLLSKSDWLTTSIGEAAVTWGILGVIWAMINVLIPDKLK